MLDLKITLIQYDVLWEKPKANRESLENIFKDISEPTNLILLPEMFNTGFTMNVKDTAEGMNGKTVGWMERWASKMNAVLAGSIIIKDKDKYYNRLVWMPPSGVAQYYDKLHLFTYGEEEKHFEAGNERKIFTHEQWRVCPQICYDLRFPEAARNDNNYDLLIYVASWPEARIDAWTSLLKARSIENLCFTAGVNRIGTDGTGKHYTGQSALIDYKGNYLIKPEDGARAVHTTLKKEELLAFRSKFPALDDQKGSQIA